MKNTAGRPVDLSDININDIEGWIKNNDQFKHCIKCQAIYSLSKGNSMQSVCNVLGVTRETIRKWKEEMRAGGLKELLSQKKAGKRSKIGKERLDEIKKIIKQKPTKYGYEEKKWTGLILVDYVKKQWEIKIGIRAAQLCLKQVR